MNQDHLSYRQRLTAATQSAQTLPQPEAAALAHSAQLASLIKDEIRTQDGGISFEQFMQLALYAPGLGYYSAGSQKFGEAGDFVTAPEISSLFSICLSNAIYPVLADLGSKNILEIGAGSGRMAADILLRLSELKQLPKTYFILEVSSELRQRQQQTLQTVAPALLRHVRWLDQLPHRFSGVVLANELLDAMPVQRFHIRQRQCHEQFVALCDRNDERFCWQSALTQNERLLARIKHIEHQLGAPLPDDYLSEVNFQAEDWIKTIAHCLQTGLLLIIDYGFPRHEYYHPQRQHGTLMCHYRHRAHDNLFVYPGLQDITAHVDFTAMADAALEAGMKVAGYTTQAHFLLENGLSECVAASDQSDVASQLKQVNEIKLLTLPQEMGELFKVMALTKNLSGAVPGFLLHDRRDRL